LILVSARILPNGEIRKTLLVSIDCKIEAELGEMGDGE
jgi:hypothetical protein